MPDCSKWQRFAAWERARVDAEDRGPQENCEDTHRRCLADPFHAREGACPIHNGGKINLDCTCSDCAAFDAFAKEWGGP